MKILLTFPTIKSVHGGARIIFAWCEGLQKLGHDVTLFVENGHTHCDWYGITFHVTNDRNAYKRFDCIIIGSPHSIWLEDFIRPHQKCFLFMQMVEELFRPGDIRWLQTCKKFYRSRFPIIHGSQWGEEYIRRKHGRKHLSFDTKTGTHSQGEMIYIPNGVNLNHFPIERPEKDGKTILLESPFSKNPAKDTDLIAYRVAAKLNKEGYGVIGYGASRFPYSDEWYCVKPSLEVMNDLYRRSTILIKATKYDARSLSPLEAGTKGCVTVRGIINGDDDLINYMNCVKVGYDYDLVLSETKRLLGNPQVMNDMRDCMYNHIQENCNWDKIINQINDVICR